MALPMTFSHGEVSVGPQEKPLRTVSCLIEGCFLVGFARGFGYVMLLRYAIVLNSRDGFEETRPSICRVTRKPRSRTIRRLKILENSSLGWSPRCDNNVMSLYL
jgi:hypothetical protein